MRISTTINGRQVDADVPPERVLTDFLRYDLGLTGTKEACSVGVCGVCSVLLNGQLVSGCLTLAVFADGAEVTTIEGLDSDPRAQALQQAFIDHGGFQCGICTPGQIVASTALLEQTPVPSKEQIQEWMEGNLCRCTGYYGIVQSIDHAAQALDRQQAKSA